MRIKAIIKSEYRPGYHFILWAGHDQIEWVSDDVAEVLQQLLVQEGYRQEY